MRLAIVAAVAVLSACGNSDLGGIGHTTTHDIDGNFVSGKLTYFKDRYGLCYAAVATDNGHFGAIVSIANVPCSALPEQPK